MSILSSTTKTLFEKRVLDSQKLFIITKSFAGVQGVVFQKNPLAAGGIKRR
jgi:hypothetical protein